MPEWIPSRVLPLPEWLVRRCLNDVGSAGLRVLEVDADAHLDTAGRPIRLTTVGAPLLHVTETVIKRAERPRLLVYEWGGRVMRWELTSTPGGTILTLWTSIDREYIAMGAAGWHLCFAVMDRWLGGAPVGRLVGADAMAFAEWQRLHREYSHQFAQ